MKKRALRILGVTLFCAMLAAVQGIGILPGTSEVTAAPSDYRSPFDLAYSPDGSMIAVSDSTKSLLYIITASTGAIARTVTLNGTPKGLAWSGNTRVYVAEYGAGTVAEVDPSNGSILRRFTTGKKPVGVAVMTGQSKLAVTDFGLKRVTIVNLTTGTILGNVTVNDYPYFVESTTNGSYAIVGHVLPNGQANNADYASTITFVDVNSLSVAANLNLPHGSSNVKEIKCSPDGQWAYVVHTLGRTSLPTTQVTKGWVNTNALTIINAAQRTIYTTVLLDRMMEGAADPWGLDISSNNNTLWVSIAGVHQVLKLDLYNLHQLLTGVIPGGSVTYYNIVNRKSGKYLDVFGGGTGDDVQLIQWLSNGGDNQKWQTIDAGGGYKKLQVKHSGKFADNKGSTAENAYIVQWSSSTSNNQQWTMTDLGGGYYRFNCRTGGLAMSIEGGSTADGAKVVQKAYTGATDQQWSLVPVSGGSYDPLNRSKTGYSQPYSDIWLQIKDDQTKRSFLKNDLGALWGAGLLTKIKLPGQGPRGIDLAPDGTKVAVGSYYAGAVYIVDVAQSKVTQTISLGSQSAEDAARRGERTWNDASTTTQKWLSCTTCHFEGRSDGVNWDMPNDGIGTPKSSKAMLGAFDTPPMMARGIRPDTITAISAGFKYIKFKQPTQQELDDVSAYIQAMTAEQDPFSNTGWTLTTDAQAGKTIFESSGTQCLNCHNGTWFTDLKIYNVGTKDVYDIDGNYDTPTLVELWKTAPYLHDGSAPTLRDVLTTKNPSNQHGTTSQLTSTQLDQLVAYLLQLKPGSSGTSTPTPVTTPTPTVTPTPTPSPIPPGVTSYEAESPSNTLGGGAVVVASSGCSGGYKVGNVGNGDGTTNGSVQFNNVYAATAGSYSLKVYYCTGQDRTAYMSINGGAGTASTYTNTGSYDTVGIKAFNITLNAGNNTIRFYNDTGWAPDFDRITVSPWFNQDIGSCSPAGSFSYNAGSYSINGAGADIWGTTDAFHFVYKQKTGDYTITARVASIQNTHAWAKAAVMIRETLNADSKYADMIVTPTSGTSFQWRAATAGTCASADNPTGGTAPKYIRLTRTGNTFTAYQSDNGSTWTQVGTGQAITMNSTVYVGLAVCSHANGTLCNATFDNVVAP